MVLNVDLVKIIILSYMLPYICYTYFDADLILNYSIFMIKYIIKLFFSNFCIKLVFSGALFIVDSALH